MASRGVTVLGVAKSTKPPEEGEGPRKPGRPATGRKPTYILYARIQPRLGAAFEAYIEATKPKPSQTAALELALEEFLTSRSFWPPPASGDQSDAD